jgi:chemotaxis protein histidine kinase CheA
LQEEGAPVGEHIVRARGAWFGNRSISAEVDLDPGKYEILPKIVASKDDSAPEVYDVVRKLADRNPQKLRQIGLNYDIANAKGVIEISEEEKKKKELKKKEAAEKKKKEKEEAEKEKAEFEAWKKEKKEKEEKEKADKEKAKTAEAEKTEESTEKKDEAKEESKKEEAKEEPKKEEAAPAETSEATKEAPAVVEPASTEKEEKKEEEKVAPAEDADNSDDEAEAAPETENTAPGALQPPAPAYGAGPGSVYGDAPLPLPPPAADTNKQNPWNAVCVLGLRVYSQDAEVSIKLVKPKDPEEGAVLDVDGATAAGATM